MRTFVFDFVIKLITLDYLVIRRVVGNFTKEYLSGRQRVNVLDLGCGTGRMAGLFGKRGYLGVDIDPKVIGFAKKMNGEHQFKVGDATNLRLNKKFDAVIVVGVAHHLSDNHFRKMLKTIYFHLKQRGRVLFIEAIPPIYQWNFLGQLLRVLDQGGHIRTLEKYKSIISKYFKVIKSQEKFGGLVDYGIVVAQR